VIEVGILADASHSQPFLVLIFVHNKITENNSAAEVAEAITLTFA
jgi:hypothetical protein